jgi:aryl-alcohol dehydrogenase-like predicted oxidoreductase
VDKVTLGRTGLEVAILGLGSGGHSRLGQRAGATKAQSIDVIHAALDLGMNVVDTAQAYGTEEIVGEALEGRRDGVVLSTKIRLERAGAPPDANAMIDAAELQRRVEESLGRLKTDRVDVLYLHGVRPHQYAHSCAELLPALQDLRRQGKVRFLGISESFGADTRHEVLARAAADGFWDVLMVGLNIVNHSALHEVLPTAAKKNIGAVCMYAVRGALAQPEGAARLVKALAATGEVEAGAVEDDDPLGFLLHEGGAETLTEAAYRFAAHAPGIHVALTGTGRVEHLNANARAVERGPLPAPVLTRIRQLFGRVTTATGDPVE